jgi:microcystin-dependent protein
VTLILPNEILNNTPADATPVEQNYALIEQYINNQMIHRDGSVAMGGQLHLVGDPTSPTDATSKGYVDALLPVGVMLPFCGQVSPAGQWALCNGATLTTAGYPKLYAVLGYRYGGSGATFMLPNMAGRVPVGMDTTQTEFSATGKSGGSFTVPLVQHAHAMPHTHTVPVHTHEHPHTHKIDHNHGSFSTVSGGAHTHLGRYKTIFHDGVVQTEVFVISTESPTGSAPLQAGLAADGAHVHTIDVPNFAGTSAAVSEATTAANVAASTGAVSTPNTANAGVAAPELQPPFVVINYIVRIG